MASIVRNAFKRNYIIMMVFTTFKIHITRQNIYTQCFHKQLLYKQQGFKNLQIKQSRRLQNLKLSNTIHKYWGLHRIHSIHI